MKIRASLAIVVVAGLAGCTVIPAEAPPPAPHPAPALPSPVPPPQVPPPPANAPLTFAALNETVSVDGLKVTPKEVLEDSRCPQNARCVWAGRLRLRVNVEGVGERELTLDEDAIETPHGAFALVAVSPGPWTDWPEGALPAYRFGFSRA